MEKYRIVLVAVSAALFSGATVDASGPWFDKAPPTLPFYLHRLPAKPIGQIFAETTAVAGPAAAAMDARVEIERFVHEVATQSPEELLAKVDALLSRARSAEFSGDWQGAPVMNLLHDLHDLIAARLASAEERKGYFQWRIDHAGWFGMGVGGEFDRTKAEQELVGKLEAAPAALRPHWIYLRGAFKFKAGDDTESEEWFKQLVEQFPEHPRAETALFMEARCRLSRSRSYTNEDPYSSDPKLRGEAGQLFERYLKKFPKGHFSGDAIGWLGAVAYDAKDYATALKYYVQQAEDAVHPELAPAAIEMCHRALSRVAAAPEDDAFTTIAEHPRLAMAMMYLINNASETDNFDGALDEPDQVQQWRKDLMPRLASAVSAMKDRYAQEDWHPRYLALLAQAASATGKHEEALQLTAVGGGILERSDDLLFAHAVALQRASRLPEAVTGYRALLTKFPLSPLAAGARLRLALTLQDAAEAGESVVELVKILDGLTNRKDESGEIIEPEPTDESAPPADESNAEPAQIRQIVDALLNFAPLPQLAQPLKNPKLDPLVRLQLTQVVAQRYLAAEDFQKAREFMTPAEWDRRAAAIEKRTREAAAAKKPDARATALLQLGNAWADARGQLVALPLDSEKTRSEVFHDEHATANLRRRDNGAALLKKADVDAELERRDELHHAFAWWLKAADASPGSATAATALWRALKAIPEIADVSPYTIARAGETDAAALAKKLYTRLRTECPKSREAREFAVYWSFPELPEEKESLFWWRGYFEGSLHDSAFRSQLFEACGVTEEEYPDGEPWNAVVSRMLELEADAATADAAAFAEKVRVLHEEVHGQASEVSESFLVNFVDDLALFAQEPKLTPPVRQRYVALRLECLRRSAWGYWKLLESKAPEGVDPDSVLREKIDVARQDPALRAIADYLDFLDAAVVANHLIDVPIPGSDKDGEPFTYRSRDYKLVEQLTRQFLARYPRSRKREAATLLHARSVYMLSKPVFQKQWTAWPAVNRWEGAFPPQFHQREPFQPKRVLDALNAYLEKYGQGRYFADVRIYRAEVAARMSDWEKALDLIIAQLEDENHASLHGDAATILGQVFARLADETQRGRILDAIKTRPRVRQAFAGYLQIDRHDHPLLYLKQYFADQLGFVEEKTAANQGVKTFRGQKTGTSTMAIR